MSIADIQITGHSFTAVEHKGQWLAARIDHAKGEIVALMFPFRLRDDALTYAMDNLGPEPEVMT